MNNLKSELAPIADSIDGLREGQALILKKSNQLAQKIELLDGWLRNEDMRAEINQEFGSRHIGSKRYVTVRDFRGKTYVDIREHFENNNGGLIATKKGISLSKDQYENLKQLMEEIDQYFAAKTDNE